MLHDVFSRLLLFWGAFVATLLTAGYIALSSAFYQGQLPPFDLRLTPNRLHILLIHNGPRCPYELPQVACQAGVRRNVFEIAYIAGGRSWQLVYMQSRVYQRTHRG